MFIIKVIIIFFLLLLAIGKMANLFDNGLSIKHEIIYIIEIALCIIGTIILFKI